MRYDQYHVAKRLTRSQTLQNEETESARGVNYTESAGEPKDHFISPFKVDDPITDHVRQVQDNSLCKSLTTPVSKHITPENHIRQQARVTPGSPTSPEPFTSLTFKDPLHMTICNQRTVVVEMRQMWTLILQILI